MFCFVSMILAYILHWMANWLGQTEPPDQLYLVPLNIKMLETDTVLVCILKMCKKGIGVWLHNKDDAEFSN